MYFFSKVIKYYQMRGAFGHQFATPPHLLNVQDSMSPTSPTPTMNSKGCPGNAGGPGNGSGNLAVSPLPGRDRIPSPQEIAIHTQNIMQNALIKRKLEEQKDNFRRRQVFILVDLSVKKDPTFSIYRINYFDLI